MLGARKLRGNGLDVALGHFDVFCAVALGGHVRLRLKRAARGFCAPLFDLKRLGVKPAENIALLHAVSFFRPERDAAAPFKGERHVARIDVSPGYVGGHRFVALAKRPGGKKEGGGKQGRNDYFGW